MRDYREYSGAMLNWSHVEIISGVKELWINFMKSTYVA